MIAVLSDLIADISLRIAEFPVQAGDLKRLSYLDVGPGGATNVAIAAARLGLDVCCLGEVGDDPFGRLLLEGLRREGIDVSDILTKPETRTPVAGVVVDAAGEPAYLGYPGDLQFTGLGQTWRTRVLAAEALFVDGWVENQEWAGIVLDGLRVVRAARVPSFFDPGAGNPAVDNAWHDEAASLATVLLATEQEAQRLSGLSDPLASARHLLASGPELVVIKRGVAGCVLVTAQAIQLSPGFPVEAVDATGAGDSLAAAVIYGYLKGLPLGALGTLANAAGAAKVQKLGTGHNVPTRDEIQAVLDAFGVEIGGL